MSLDHLKRWMPWAHEEPRTLDERIVSLRRFRAQFDTDADFVYGIFGRDESEILGGIGSHTRQGSGIREIGYWIRADRLRCGYATESAAAIAKAAFEIEHARRVEIRCDPKNIASAGVPKKLGFTREGLLRRHIELLGSARDTEVWSLLVEEYAESPAKALPIKAYGASGEALLG